MTDTEENELPIEFSLMQNYPNPFNPSTIIEYNLKEEAHVIISVYNLLGEQVSVLVNSVKPLGSYKVRFNGNNLAGGVYFYTLQINDLRNVVK